MMRQAVGVLAAGSIGLVLAGGGLGYRAAVTETGAAVVITGSPHAVAAWPLALIAVLVSLGLTRPATAIPAPPGRVLLAWVIDVAMYLVVTMVPTILLALWIDASTTGAFAWTVSRDVLGTADVLMWPVTVVAFALFWAAPGVVVWMRGGSVGGVITGVSMQVDRDVPIARLAATTMLKYFARGLPLVRDPRRPGGFELRALRAA
jgi:hypothetical protein